MPRDALVLKIQRELCHPKCARLNRKVSELSRNRPLARVLARYIGILKQKGRERGILKKTDIFGQMKAFERGLSSLISEITLQGYRSKFCENAYNGRQ